MRHQIPCLIEICVWSFIWQHVSWKTSHVHEINALCAPFEIGIDMSHPCFIGSLCMESRCAMTIVFCLFIFGNSFCLIAFVNCFLLIAFWCLLFVNWFMLFAHFIFYVLSAAFSTIWLVCFNGHRNFAMRNSFSIDSNVKFHIVENWMAMLIVNCFCLLLIVYCLMIFAYCKLLFANCLLSNANCYLLIAFCFLLFAICQLFFAYC